MKKYIIIAISLIAFLPIVAKDIRTLRVTTVPQMSCHNCENRIKKNIRFEKGVKNIETDLEAQIVAISYDADKTNEDALIKAFEKIDYEAIPLSGELPEEEAKTTEE